LVANGFHFAFAGITCQEHQLAPVYFVFSAVADCKHGCPIDALLLSDSDVVVLALVA
jgi:hypothetical protein